MKTARTHRPEIPTLHRCICASPQLSFQELDINPLRILRHSSFPPRKTHILEDPTRLIIRRRYHPHMPRVQRIGEDLQQDAEALAGATGDGYSVRVDGGDGDI